MRSYPISWTLLEVTGIGIMAVRFPQLLHQIPCVMVIENAHEFAEIDIRDAVSPLMTSMFSSLTRCDGWLKFAEPVTTIGSSLKGSINRNLLWM